MRILNVCRLNKTLKKRNIILIGNDGLICGVWNGRGVRSIIITNFELLKVAIDMGIETPDYIPSIPTFRNKIKENYKNASETFEKAFRDVEKDPSLAIGLANSVLESIVKDVLRANQVQDYSERDTLTELVRKCFKHFRMNDSSLPSEIKSIANSILNAAKSIEDIRRDKTSFHGKSSEYEVISQPEYAYFVINAVTTIGLFFLKYHPKQKQAIIQNFDDDLPF